MASSRKKQMTSMTPFVLGNSNSFLYMMCGSHANIFFSGKEEKDLMMTSLYVNHTSVSFGIIGYIFDLKNHPDSLIPTRAVYGKNGYPLTSFLITYTQLYNLSLTLTWLSWTVSPRHVLSSITLDLGQQLSIDFHLYLTGR